MALVALCSIVTAYCLVFTGLAEHDDEGTLMAITRDFMAGQALYDQAPTIYGPVFYLCQALAHIAFRTAVSCDSVRWITFFFWVTASLMVLVLLYRTTGSMLLALVANFITFRQLGFLAEAPSHPQEICIVLLLGLAMVACSRLPRSWTMMLLGALAGAMLLTKINLGIFATAALAVVFAYGLPPDLLGRIARIAVSLATLLLPAALMSGLFAEGWVVRFCAVESLSLLGAMIVLWRRKFDPPIRIRETLLAIAGFAVVLIAISACVVLRGSSVTAMIHWMVVVPRKAFGAAWFVPLPLSGVAIVWSALWVMLAIAAAFRALRPPVIAILKLAVFVAVVFFWITLRYAGFIGFVPPMLWLVAIRPDEGATSRLDEFPRAILLLTGVFQLLYAYPVAGSQVMFAEIFVTVVAAICLADALPTLSRYLAPVGRPERGRLATVAMVGLLLVGWVSTAWPAVDQYRNSIPLNLPGSTRVRLDADRVQHFRELVALTSSNSCRTLVTAPGLPRFNIWTGLPSPPQLLGGGNWLSSIPDDVQESVVRQLAPESGTCLIYNPDLVNFWTRRGVPPVPMVRFFQESFRTVAQEGNYQFMLRK